MNKPSQKELREIANTVATEFPNDPALQRVHVAQRLIARQAVLSGMTIPQYIRSLRKAPAERRRRIG
jgi:hypothetical protein